MIIRNLQSKIILPFNTVETLRSRLSWYINLRWLSIFAILTSIPIVQRLLHLEISYKHLVLIASILLAFNLFYFLLSRHLPYSDKIRELIFAEVQIVGDLIILSFLIHYSGGISNPFFFLYNSAGDSFGNIIPRSNPSLLKCSYCGSTVKYVDLL